MLTHATLDIRSIIIGVIFIPIGSFTTYLVIQDILSGKVVLRMENILYIIPLVFLCIGLFLVIHPFYAVHKARKIKACDEPWNLNKKWVKNEIRSDAMSTMIFFLAFTAVWISASFVITGGVLGEMSKGDYSNILFMLFPMISIGLLYFTIKTTKQWLIFGNTLLRLDPFPGSIGGQVGGIISINKLHETNAGFRIELSCTRSTRSTGNGIFIGNNDHSNKSREYRETIWIRHINAVQTRTAKGIDISFKFNVPHNLPSTELTTSEQRTIFRCSQEHIVWELKLTSKTKIGKLDRKFEIPVFNTGEHYSQNAETPISATPANNHITPTQTLPIDSILPLSITAGTTTLEYPPGRDSKNSKIIMIIGIGLIVTGFFVFGGLIVIAAGGFMLLRAIYHSNNSLTVALDSMGVSSTRSLFSYAIRNHHAPYSQITNIRPEEIREPLDFKTTDPENIQEHYRIVASSGDKKITIAEDIATIERANLAANFLKELVNQRT